ncbi:16S rRNA (cytosine(967)-C(5))-methyltransferase RsmB [Peptoniphilus sp. KCTC 25270]|uniref:16S rRNA (cytosine(967)-C(5))-methyltransferase RsmB n=1 Tax=Peptoniphilus sp. KCTC 25270 TaxID=2897414 RepID=UPI001E50C38F|nr:16S rRNA (cytosine(967)-C(5))-methyltransferase RsmB [Peptoniphilus sp. KCTC 25270]MCD1147113.1 16S rRNA (cytosine(967)-C(5))-methyltransferase RsmB [Peptoniphilus sp. KCTC 25270]
MTKKVREYAFEILRDYEEGIYLKDSLSLIGNKISDERDRRFLQEITYGTVSNEIFLDAVLSKFVKRNQKIQKNIRIILRLALYQIHFLDRIPNHAIVNEAVELTKTYGNKKASGFVNGVLRNVLRNPQAFQIETKDHLEKLSLEYSFSKEWIKYFQSVLSKEEVPLLLESMNQQAPFSIRSVQMNREKLAEELKKHGFASKLSEISNEGLIIENPNGLFETEFYKKGDFYVQDIASQMVAKMLSEKGKKGLDVCAAPGGKTFQLLRKCDQVVAADSNENRLLQLKENAQRLGLTKNLDIQVQDGTQLHKAWVQSFDRIIVDAPCSGIGLIRRKPEIKNRVTWKDCKELSKIQLKILENSAQYLSMDGELVYSTCTITKVENEEVVDAFLKKNPDFEKASSWKRYWPHIHGTDGFSMILLKRKG